eukprot:4272600-Prymnesium_polylepis.1
MCARRWAGGAPRAGACGLAQGRYSGAPGGIFGVIHLVQARWSSATTVGVTPPKVSAINATT